MSSWSRSAKVATAVAVCALAAPDGVINAADNVWQPSLDLRVASNTNRNLAIAPSQQLDSYGYSAEFGLLFTSSTQRSDLTLRPVVRLQDYTDTSDLENVEGRLDLRGEYRWQRSRLEFTGQYSHEDLLNAELPSATFNPVNPLDPSSSTTGRAAVGETRDYLRLQPSYSYDLTQIWAIGASSLYESARYDGPTGLATADYDYLVGSLFGSYAFSPRVTLQVGPYVSRYEVTENSTSVDAIGVELSTIYRWTETYRAELSLLYESNEITYGEPFAGEETETGFGALATLVREGTKDQLRLVGGRSFVPNSDGYKAVMDQLRVQYDRSLTQRFSCTGAFRYESSSSLGSRGDVLDRDYLVALASVRYAPAQNWYVGFGYQYSWQQFDVASEDANNSSFFLTGGYGGRASRW